MTRTGPKVLKIATLILGATALSACSSGGSQPAAAATTSAPSGATTSSQPAVVDPGATATGASAATTAPDPCSLITDVEAATLFGGPVAHKVGASRDASHGGVVVTENTCEWSEITSSQHGYDLWVAVYNGADRAYFDDAATHETPLPGLGDAATGDTIHVRVISKGIVLQIYGSLPVSNGLQKATAIAIGKL